MSSDWFDDDEFWGIFGDCMFRPDRFEAAADEIESVLALTGVATRRVLDLGCGPGRHAVPLARRGLDVTAVDLSKPLLDRARAYAGTSEVDVEWVHQDMRAFRRPGGFDLILSMWTSFGYFEDPSDDALVLENCHANLADGGALLLDMVGKEYVIRHLEPVHLTEFDNGDLLVERPVLEDGMRRYANEWILIQGDKAHRAQWHHNLYTGQELEDRVRAAGFADVAVHGGLDGQEYDLDAERLVLVAWK